ncbi:MAG: hypothetical protein ACR2I2_20410 [Bryobacteraceae bacterium]
MPPGKVDFYGGEKEAALGKQLAAEFRQRTIAIGGRIVQNYLDRLGKRLSPHLPDAKFPYVFSAVADDLCPSTHEPVALPGGYIFVPVCSSPRGMNPSSPVC